MTKLTIDSPVGPLTLTEEAGAITRLSWGKSAPESGSVHVLGRAQAWLDAYFAGTVRPVTVKLDPRGTPFQRRVWQAMLAIPPGATATYGDLAQQLGSGARAVGGACGANPIPILIPCHRVVAADGGLGGYSGAGGLKTKRTLLDLESRADLALVA